MKQVILIILVAILIVLILKFAFTPEKLSLKLNRTTYNENEQVEIEIKNISDEPVSITGVTIEYKENNNWKAVRFYTSCPCNYECKMDIYILKPTETKSEVWDMKITGCETPKLGQYRAIIYENTGQVLGVSDNFMVKL